MLTSAGGYKHQFDSNHFSASLILVSRWSSFVTQQTYHLGIALKSSGPMAGPGGYHYSQMVEIWKAANVTKSNVIMYWWTPELLFEDFAGTDAEFTRITLPNPTQTCVENRVYSTERCPENGIATAAQLAGSPEGACDDAPNPISKVVSTGLRDMLFDPSIPDALRSPGYAAVKQFGMSDTQLSEVFQYWKRYGDPREAVCEWIVDNHEWAREFIPRTYPRTKQESTHRSGPLQYVSYSLAGLAIAMVVVTCTAVYHNRKLQAIVFAQIEFLFLLLAGLFVISLGSLMTSLPATDGTCVASIWFVNLGYSLELIPLLVKISAINRLMSAALRMKRVVLSRQALFGAVFLISLVVVIFLMIWTILDPPRESKEYVLGETDDIGQGDSSTKVLGMTYCSSEKDFWSYTSFAWIGGMLVAATVLAIQSRNIRQDFNESQTLGVMIYSHFVFVVLRVAIHTLPAGVLSREVLTQYQSMSVDTIVTIIVYFLPKLSSSPSAVRRSTSTRLSMMQAYSVSWDAAVSEKSTAITLPGKSSQRYYKCTKCHDLVRLLPEDNIDENASGSVQNSVRSLGDSPSVERDHLDETSGSFIEMLPRQQGHYPDQMEWSTCQETANHRFPEEMPVPPE
jgi:hypothetical protein